MVYRSAFVRYVQIASQKDSTSNARSCCLVHGELGLQIKVKVYGAFEN